MNINKYALMHAYVKNTYKLGLKYCIILYH